MPPPRRYMDKEARAHGQSLNRIYNHQSTELEQQIRKVTVSARKE